MSREAVADQVKAVWIDLLNVEHVRDRDHFVELGGDSVAATLCVSRIHEVFGVDVHVTSLLLDDVDFSTLVEEVHSHIAGGKVEALADRT